MGQFFAPMYNVVGSIGFFHQAVHLADIVCTKLARLLASSASSPDETICFPSGPSRSSMRLFVVALHGRNQCVGSLPRG